MVLFVLFPTGIYAKGLVLRGDTLQPLLESMQVELLPSVYLYGGGSYSRCDYWKLISDKQHNKLYTNGISGGLTTEFIIHDQKYSYFGRFGVSLGYSYRQFAVHPWIYNSEGVNTHWLTADAYFGISYLVFGFTANTLLANNVNNADTYTYSGIYDDCLRKFVPGVFFGLQLMSPIIRFEARFGYNFYPYMNVDCLAYHNNSKIQFERFFIEARLAVPLYVMGNKSYSATPSVFFWIREKKQ